MSLPRLTNVTGIPFSLPSLPEYQTWAINLDTTPPSLVIVEFPYSRPRDLTSPSNTLNALNATLEQTSIVLNSQLQILENRISGLEIQLSNIFTMSQIPQINATGV